MALTPKRFWRKMALLAKIESDYGVSSAPTGAVNALLGNDVTLTPLAGEEERRDLITPYFGHQGVMFVGNYVELQFGIEAAGSGAAGTAPAYGPLLRACGLAETLTALTSAAYQPASSGQESATLFANIDGVNHIMLGARGTATLEFTPKRIPRFRFTLRGLLGPIADVALPAVTLTAFKKPLPVSKANTPTYSLHGYSAVGESLSFDLGNQVEVRNLIGEDSIQITDRQATGTAVIEAKSLATKDWFAIAQAETKGALSFVHGLVAGAIVELAAAAVQLGRPTYGQTQGITNYSIPLMLTPTNGDDEFSLIIR